MQLIPKFSNLQAGLSNKFIILMSNPTHQKKNSKLNHYGQGQMQHLALIQGEVQKKFVNPEDSSYCNCNICKANYELKERGKAFLRQTSSNLKIQSSKMQEFLQLVTVVNAKTSLRMDIPEICFFSKGQPRKLFKSNNSGIHQVQLTPLLKKTLINVFIENRKVYNGNKNKESTLDFLTENRQPHINNFSDVIPSYKHGQKIAAKKPQTVIFHKNPNYQDDPNFAFNQSQSEEICIVKSKDKGFELMNEKQLRTILKSLLFLQNVEYIQTYIKPNQKEDQIYEANYSRSSGPDNMLMYNRSLIQIKTQINLINKFSKDYIPVEHLENYEVILKDIPLEYCIYQTYKMIHYMELTKDVIIEKLGTCWLRNEAEQIIFFGLVQFQWRQNQKFSVDIGEIQQLKEIMSSQLTDFQQQLLNAWQHMKNRKIKIPDKPLVDQNKQIQFEKIKQESLIRQAREKEEKKVSRKKTYQKSSKSFDITQN